MGEKITSIINEHLCRALLNKDELDYSKFYRKQIEQFLDVSRIDNKNLKSKINQAKLKIQEIKEHIDKSKFDGMTKSILIMSLNEIIYSLNGKVGEDSE
jgi:hypothetical protein